MSMGLYTMPSGDKVCREGKAIVVKFTGKRSVISTCHLNGGYREDLTAVYNDNTDHGDCKGEMTEAMFIERMKIRTREMGLDPARTAVMGTAVCMDNAVIRSLEYKGLSVTAIVTGGIESNGGRAGDPASFFESDGRVFPVGGTINVILAINARVSSYALTRAIVTLTEAKTAAIQELLLGSCYSTGIATGSGTDQVIVYGNDEADLRIVYTGKHAMAGELIGRVVKEAVKEALFKHMGASPASQHSMLRRLKRYGITEDRLWETFNHNHPKAIAQPDFIESLRRIDGMNKIVTMTSLYVHLIDQAGWGLLSGEEARWAGDAILGEIAKVFRLQDTRKIKSSGDLTRDMLDAFAQAMAEGAVQAAAVKIEAI